MKTERGRDWKGLIARPRVWQPVQNLPKMDAGNAILNTESRSASANFQVTVVIRPILIHCVLIKVDGVGPVDNTPATN